MPVVENCTPAGFAGIAVPVLMLLLLGRTAFLIATRRPAGFGAAGLVSSKRRGPAGTVSALLLLAGFASLAVSRLVYSLGNPGGPAPEPVFIAISAAMLGLLVFLAWPLARGLHYTLRGSWYALAGLAAFLVFFATVDLPCGALAASWVFYGIVAAMSGAVLRIWTLLGK